MDDARNDLMIPDELPVLPLREMVVFPYMVLPLFIARERSVAAVHFLESLASKTSVHDVGVITGDSPA